MPTQLKLPGRTEIDETVIEGELRDRTLWVDERHVPACVALWRTGEFTELGIRDTHDKGLKNVDFIASFFPVSRLHLMVPDRVDLSVLQGNAEWLTRFFTNAGPNALDDITPFTRLESLGQPWTPRFRVDASLDRLKHLGLTGFKPASGDVASLSVLRSLESLSLFRTQVTSLRGVESLAGLHRLAVDSAPKLEDIDAIAELTQLRELAFENCKAARGFASLVQGAHVTQLRVMKCAALEHVRFVRRLPALQSFVFMDTDVLDGDMAPLVEHPTLAHVALTRRKHFTLSERDILDQIGHREGGVMARHAAIEAKARATAQGSG